MIFSHHIFEGLILLDHCIDSPNRVGPISKRVTIKFPLSIWQLEGSESKVSGRTALDKKWLSLGKNAYAMVRHPDHGATRHECSNCNHSLKR